MKILHIITSLGPGGAEGFLKSLATVQKNNDYKVSILILLKQDDAPHGWDSKDIDLHSLGLRRGVPSFRSLVRALKIVKSNDWDVVQAWMYHANFLLFIIKILSLRRGKIKFFYSIRHSLDDLANEKWLTRFLIKIGALTSGCLDGVLFNSKRSLQQHERIGYDASKSKFIGNGFDIKKFNILESSKSLVRRELGLPDKCSILGLVGRFHPTKNHEFFFEVINKISALNQPTHFVLLGKDTDSVKIKSLAEKCGVFHLGTFVGTSRKVSKFYNAFDITINCSISESFPNVIAESMLTGTPCVVSDVGCSREIIGQWGVVIEEFSVEKWAELIINILDDKNMPKQEIRKHIAEKFSMKAIFQQYDEYYRNTSCAE